MHSGKSKIFRYLIPVFVIATSVFFASQSIFANSNDSNITQINQTEAVAAAPHAEGNEHHDEDKVDAGRLIMEHIADAYDWHMATIGHTHISIPLPIILKDDIGWHVFLSSKFEHGHAEVEGYRLEHNKIVNVNGLSFIDLSITKNVASMFMAVITLLIIMLSVASKYKKNAMAAPNGMQGLLEPIILFIRDEVAKPSIGHKYAKFLPFLLTIFFFIFINNLFGLIPFFPGGANVTGNIAVTLVLAMFTFVITSINGNKTYWAHIFLPPGVPKVLWILLIPIEIIGMLNKPIVLMIRLFANITAGHIIILGFFSLIFIFGAVNQTLGLGVSVLSVAFTVFMSMLELLVAFLQAYVFTLLSALYFGSAVEEHHHEEHH